MANTEQPKIKCYTMTMNGSTLIDSNLDNLAETLKVELQEIMKKMKLLKLNLELSF